MELTSLVLAAWLARAALAHPVVEARQVQPAFTMIPYKAVTTTLMTPPPSITAPTLIFAAPAPAPTISPVTTTYKSVAPLPSDPLSPVLVPAGSPSPSPSLGAPDQPVTTGFPQWRTIPLPGSAPSPSTGGAGACTHTLDVTLTSLSTAPYWTQCAFDGTQTLYPATRTALHEVDCGGCDQVQINVRPIIHCPAMIYNASVTAATPRTETQTVCSGTASTRPQEAVTTATAVPVPAPTPTTPARAACPTTVWVSAPQWGGMFTPIVYQMATVTQSVACGGCPLVVATKIGGQGPVWKPLFGYPTVSTSTVYRCQTAS